MVLKDGPWRNDNGDIIRECIAALTITPVFLILRFWARGVTHGDRRKSRFWWDDWLALGCLPLAIAQAVIGIEWTKAGLGRHIYVLSVADVLLGMKLFYASFFITIVGSVLPKLSLLCFYARIFSSYRQFRPSLWVIGGLSILWGAACFLSALFQCDPVKKGWNQFIPGKCIDYYVFLICIQLLSMALDFLIACLPVIFIHGLKLSASRKLFIGLVFICGHAMVIFPIGRTVVVIQGDGDFITDLTLNILPIGRWIVMQIPISVCTLCIPVTPVLFARAYHHGIGSLFSSKTRIRTTATAVYEREQPSVLRASSDSFDEVDERAVYHFNRMRFQSPVHMPSSYYAVATRSSNGALEHWADPSQLEKNEGKIQVTKEVRIFDTPGSVSGEEEREKRISDALNSAYEKGNA